MNIDFLYKNVFGRLLMKILQKAGLIKVSAWFLQTRISRIMIPHYVKKHKIKMREFEGQVYDSFASFFARSKTTSNYVINSDGLISPCDGLLTVYPITEDLEILMKGSRYRLKDLIPDVAAADHFHDGLCMVFRLRAEDYHHFCCFDDSELLETHFIPGKLHSVQPIACEKIPVYRLNRRWWSLLRTVHFGTVAQIEVGAMMVGGVTFAKKTGYLSRGEEMGNFELAGSTILLLFDASVRSNLILQSVFGMTMNGKIEIPVAMGEEIGILQTAEK